MAPSIPEVKISNNADPHRSRSPDRKMDAVDAVDHRRMRPQLFIRIIVDPSLEFL